MLNNYVSLEAKVELGIQVFWTRPWLSLKIPGFINPQRTYSMSLRHMPSTLQKIIHSMMVISERHCRLVLRSLLGTTGNLLRSGLIFTTQ